MSVLAIDVAVLPPSPVSDLAIALSNRLPEETSKGLRLGAQHLPHITLTQQFVATDSVDDVLARVADVLSGTQALTLHVPRAVRSREAIWLAIDRSPELLELHRRLMDALLPCERPAGGPTAFAGGDARPGDVRWVSSYRSSASFSAYTPHITLGHAASAPHVEPMTFTAMEVAACQLGRFCSCRKVLRAWTLPDAGSRPAA